MRYCILAIVWTTLRFLAKHYFFMYLPLIALGRQSPCSVSSIYKFLNNTFITLYGTSQFGDPLLQKNYARRFENGVGGGRTFEPPRIMPGINQDDHFY